MAALSKMSKDDLADYYEELTGKPAPANATRNRLRELVQAAEGKAPRRAPRAAAQPAARSGGGSPRPHSAALSKSVPTVRMRVDEHDVQSQRRPGSADILAVALVVFLSILAAGGTALEKRHAPTGTVPAVYGAPA